jgi:hypothetical protein
MLRFWVQKFQERTLSCLSCSPQKSTFRAQAAEDLFANIHDILKLDFTFT